MSTVEVPLSRGYVAFIDAADADLVLPYKWYARPHRRTVYAIRNTRRENGSHTTQSLHRLLTGYARTDHINGDGLDNRRSNLREVTHGQNNQNSRRRLDNLATFKGVGWDKHRAAWRARINVDGKRCHVGFFPTAEEAARAYDSAAREMHGEYAALNFPAPGERAA